MRYQVKVLLAAGSDGGKLTVHEKIAYMTDNKLDAMEALAQQKQIGWFTWEPTLVSCNTIRVSQVLCVSIEDTRLRVCVDGDRCPSPQPHFHEVDENGLRK